MEWILQNKEWLFSGIGLAFFSFVGFLLKPAKEKKGVTNEIKNKNSTVVNVNVGESKNNTMEPQKKSNKNETQILFIDDEKFDIVSILKNAGWTNTKTIKDIKNLDSLEIKNANIIFVDINGVGCTLFPTDQGLGLAEAIKNRNPEKYVIIYSAQEQRLHKAFSIVDAVLPKNAEPYEFLNILENYSRDYQK